MNIGDVNPNNIFWAVNGAPQFENVNSLVPHKLFGNFVGKSGTPIIGNNAQITGRILGFVSAPNIVGSGTITAITSTDQPSIVPVLQIHSPEGTPSNSSTNLPTDGNLDGQWLQRVTADNVTINAVFVSGNSPSRPEESNLAGLHNFVRFLERWADTPLNIKGSFMQLRRSAYATAPFANVLAAKKSADDGTLSIFGYRSTSYNGSSISYYTPPTRQWGFDVGLLSQSPDLFAQKFTLPATTPPDEFFRQVGQDDPWVQNLLCAAEKPDPRINTYVAAIGNQRPSSCPASLSSYAD